MTKASAQNLPTEATALHSRPTDNKPTSLRRCPLPMATKARSQRQQLEPAAVHQLMAQALAVSSSNQRRSWILSRLPSWCVVHKQVLVAMAAAAAIAVAAVATATPAATVHREPIAYCLQQASS